MCPAGLDLIIIIIIMMIIIIIIIIIIIMMMMMMMMIIIIIIIIIIINALKGAIPNSYNLLTAPRTRKWSGAIVCNASDVYRVKHVMCHLVQRDSSALKFD